MFKQKFLSQDFILKLIEKAARKVSQNLLEDFLSKIENETKLHYFTKTSESNLLRIIQNQFDIAFFINECLKFPHQIEILIIISSNSNYLTDILVRNPEYFHWIINPSILEQKIDYTQLKNNLEKTILAFRSFDSKVNAIRNFKRKEILRIGLKDIYLKEELLNVTKNLSDLANVISSTLFELCYSEVLTKHGIENTTRKFVLFSLGKLGGNELNYSSDIDIVAFYDKNSLINKKNYYNEILSESISLFIENASKKTGAGFLYRVDFRLRPDGRNAPLCSSFTEYLRYYEMRGEDWERQMLIKANYLCGSKSLFKKFYEYISKFIYPSSFSVSPIEQIKKLKSSIEKRNKSDENIKLVSGGIRDIEFSIQALQLLNGGKDSSLRNGNSIKTIVNLKAKNILSESESEIFVNAYTLYRRSEHYLQLMNDQQTHSIPAEGEIAEKLAYYLGYKNISDFKNNLEKSKNQVQSVYKSIVGIEKPIEINNILDSIKFNDLKRAKSNYEYLRTGKNIFEKKQYDTRTITAFEKIERQLVDYLSTSIDPDLVLDNFSRVIKTANFPQIWFEEFIDSKFFNLFLFLCEQCQKAVDLFAEDKILRDDFLSRDSLLLFNQDSLSEMSLKLFHFRSSVQLCANLLTSENFSRFYTDFLNTRFSSSIENFTSDKPWKNDYFVAAMGSFGASELTFNSDIDLIFVVSNIQDYSHIQKDFLKLLQKLKDNFPGVEIDCRLRPEGKSSQLVWDITDYKKYFDNRARVWELQTFTKLRKISGSDNLFLEFINHFIKTINLKDKTKIISEMNEMRKKLLPINDDSFNLKKSSGGITDIDFIVSYLLLTNTEKLFENITNNSISKFNILKNISAKHINLDLLETNFYFLKNIELSIQFLLNTKLSKIPNEDFKLLKLSKICKFNSTKIFMNSFNEVIKNIRIEYQNTFN